MDKPDNMPQHVWDSLPPVIKEILEGGAVAVPVEIPDDNGLLDFDDKVARQAWLNSWVGGVVKLCEQDKERFDLRITLMSANAKMWESACDEARTPAELQETVQQLITVSRKRMRFLTAVLKEFEQNPDEVPEEWKPHLPVIVQVMRSDIFEVAPMFIAILIKSVTMAGQWINEPILEGA